jgi:hypothetical protein
MAHTGHQYPLIVFNRIVSTRERIGFTKELKTGVKYE